MAAVTICNDFGVPPKKSLSLFPLFTHLGKHIFKLTVSNFIGKFTYIYILHKFVPIFNIYFAVYF